MIIRIIMEIYLKYYYWIEIRTNWILINNSFLSLLFSIEKFFSISNIWIMDITIEQLLTINYPIKLVVSQTLTNLACLLNLTEILDFGSLIMAKIIISDVSLLNSQYYFSIIIKYYKIYNIIIVFSIIKYFLHFIFFILILNFHFILREFYL